LAAARRGETQALTELVERHHGQVWRFCRHLTGDATLADDLAQDTMVVMCTNLAAYSGRGSFNGWLLRIARNRVIDRARSNERRRERHRRQPLPVSPSPELSAALTSAIDALPDELAEVLLAAELFGLTHAEISAAVGIPVGTVKSRVFRARRILRTHLEDTNHE